MLTPATENVLIAICNLPEKERQSLKLAQLAHLAQVSINSVRRAIPRLQATGLITCTRRRRRGIDALLNVSINPDAQLKANLMKHVQGYQNVPLP